MKLYRELAGWWPFLSPPGEYVDEARLYRGLLQQVSDSIESLLELGSGGGHLASHFPADLHVELSDLSPDMLEVSRNLNPNRIHHHGDMRNLRLERHFDSVFLQDAVMYLTAERDLAAAFATAHHHLRPGGAFLVCPDVVTETFQERAEACGGSMNPGRAGQIFEWCWDPDPGDTTFQTEFAYMLRDESGHVECVLDRHTMGLFPRATWYRLLDDAGFERVDGDVDPNVEHGELFLCRKR